MINLAATASGKFLSSSTTELKHIYGDLGTSKFFDVTAGTCGGDSAAAGWDKCTGVGTPRGVNGLK
jgi:hypothetical protein